MASRSRKSEIIEALFKQRWNAQTKALTNAVVTLNDVSGAIEQYNSGRPPSQRLSTKNPANFFKDFIRNKRRANANWPLFILQAGYTARQVTGQGRCFEFVEIPPGQAVPFPETVVPLPDQNTPRHRVESVSLPLASRRLGRAEETWIVQVVVRLRIIETHLSLFSPRRERIVQVDHLQMSVKQSNAEIDALFLIQENGGDQSVCQEVIVCCEAKGLRDDLLEDQIVQQVRAVFRLPGVTQDLAVPIGVKVVGRSEIYVVEFEAVTRDQADNLESLRKASGVVYELSPPVPGIGHGLRRRSPKG